MAGRPWEARAWGCCVAREGGLWHAMLATVLPQPPAGGRRNQDIVCAAPRRHRPPGLVRGRHPGSRFRLEGLQTVHGCKTAEEAVAHGVYRVRGAP
eukprot:12674869-Alexandrium_andersonii.AAC.1